MFLKNLTRAFIPGFGVQQNGQPVQQNAAESVLLVHETLPTEELRTFCKLLQAQIP